MRVLTLLSEGNHGAIVETEIEDGFHHPRHGHGGARSYRDEKRISRVAEFFPRSLFEARDIAFDLGA